jgi:GT2 family glycosyltransferase
MKQKKINQPELLIIVVNWNTKEKLEKCLYSIKDLGKSIFFEVLVIDNNSNDGSIEMLKNNYKDYNLIFNKNNLGFAAANNIGFVKFPNFNFYLLLNSDAEINFTTLDGMMDIMKKKPSIGLTGPALIHEDGQYQVGGAGYGPHWSNSINTFLFLDKLSKSFLGLFLKQKKYKEVKAPIEVTWLAFACTLVRRKMLDEVGYFDEYFFVYGEDSDLCWRAIKKKWGVAYLPYLKIIHFLGGSSKDKGRVDIKWFENLAYSINKNGTKTDYRVFVVSSIFGYGLRLIFSKIKVFFQSSIENKKLNLFYFNLFKASLNLKFY